MLAAMESAKQCEITTHFPDQQHLRFHLFQRRINHQSLQSSFVETKRYDYISIDSIVAYSTLYGYP